MDRTADFTDCAHCGAELWTGHWSKAPEGMRREVRLGRSFCGGGECHRAWRAERRGSRCCICGEEFLRRSHKARNACYRPSCEEAAVLTHGRA